MEKSTGDAGLVRDVGDRHFAVRSPTEQPDCNAQDLIASFVGGHTDPSVDLATRTHGNILGVLPGGDNFDNYWTAFNSRRYVARMVYRQFVSPQPGEDLAAIARRVLPGVPDGLEQLQSWNLHLFLRQRQSFDRFAAQRHRVRRTAAAMTPIITRASIAGGHDGRAEVEVEDHLRQRRNDDHRTRRRGLPRLAPIRAGVSSVEELVGQPWSVVLPGLERQPQHLNKGTVNARSSSVTQADRRRLGTSGPQWRHRNPRRSHRECRRQRPAMLVK
ncbi:MAG: hypothetical protein R2710_16370 [Acidimicrobiales bacterium]